MNWLQLQPGRLISEGTLIQLFLWQDGREWVLSASPWITRRFIAADAVAAKREAAKAYLDLLLAEVAKLR